MPFPFEVPFAQLEADLDTYVNEVFGALKSEFLTLPKGNGFIDYPVFEQGTRHSSGQLRALVACRQPL